MQKDQVKNINSNKIPKEPGIYFWYADKPEFIKIANKIGLKIINGQVCVYIGKTTNLQTRFKTHTNSGYKAPRRSTLSWTLRSLLGMDDANLLIQNLYFEFKLTKDLENEELKAIKKYNPILNLDDCFNQYSHTISEKRKEYKKQHLDIWKV